MFASVSQRRPIAGVPASALTAEAAATAAELEGALICGTGWREQSNHTVNVQAGYRCCTRLYQREGNTNTRLFLYAVASHTIQVTLLRALHRYSLLTPNDNPRKLKKLLKKDGCRRQNRKALPPSVKAVLAPSRWYHLSFQFILVVMCMRLYPQKIARAA